MDPTHLVRNFLKLQKALEKLEKNGILLGCLRRKGLNQNEEALCDDYSDKELCLARKVKDLFEKCSEKNVFCCGGTVKLPEHD